MPQGSERYDRFRQRARSAARRMDQRLRKTTDRLQEWKRARIDPPLRPAYAAVAPAAARYRDWRDRFMASEFAPAPLSKPGKAEYWTLGLFAAFLLSVLLFLAWFDWNYLRGPIGNYASERFNRDIEIAGDLDVDVLRWSPEIHVEGLRIGGPDWADERDTADIAELDVAIRFLPLLTGNIELPSIQATNAEVVLIEDAEGRQSWVLGGDEASEDSANLPVIQRLIVEDGRLIYENARRRITLNATVNATETATPGEGGFQLVGEGTLNGNPLTLTVTGGPLIHVERDQPYAFDASLRGGGTVVTAEGSINRPFDLRYFQADITARGQDLADAYYLTTVPFPNTPPYRLNGRLSRDEETWSFNDFTGRVGDSDLSGDVEVSKPGERRLVEATLRSTSLDLDDLLALTGAPPDTGETASAEQEATAGQLRSQGRLLPDAPLFVERLRTMDARVDFRATSVRRNELAVRAVRLGVNLDQGVLDLDPIAFDFASGRLNATARIDGSRDVPYTTLDARLTGYPIQTIVPAVGGSQPISGAITARARLEGPGASVHRFASNSSGTISVVMPRGEMRQAFAELLGINVGAGLFRLLSGDHSPTPVRCAVADFRVSGGTATARTLVVDTGVVLVNGSGTVDLGSERMNLRLDGETKEPRLLRVWAPITVNGPIRRPGLGVEGGEVAAQVGIAAALGALVSPLAAILPFVDPGLAEDADCGALIASAG